MSRTKKGTKRPGHEYQGARPGKMATGGLLGPLSKRETHKAERQQGKKETKERGS